MKSLRAIVPALAALAMLLLPAPAQAARSAPFLLQSNATSNLCLEATGISSGSRVVLATCNVTATRQMWMLQNNERLQNVAGYLNYEYRGYLDYDISAGPGNGRKVQVYDYIANAQNQKWEFNQASPVINSKKDWRCLDADISGGNNPPRAGTRIQMYGCSYMPNQSWTRWPVPAAQIPAGL
jgi:hypothetical protein